MRRLLWGLLLFPLAASGITFGKRPEVAHYVASGAPVVIVNIPEFKLRFYQGGELKLESKVILGREDRQTPTMTKDMTHVVINPYWNVSARLARLDILPKYRDRKDDFIRHGFEVLDGWGNDAPALDPHRVDFDQCINNKGCPFRVRQKPGPFNFLGVVKFLFPNGYHVYIHDTPSKHLFEKDKRTFSSGCIRTQDPIDLGAMILGMTVEEFQQLVATDRRTAFLLAEPIKVLVTDIPTAEGSYQYPPRRVLSDIKPNLRLDKTLARP